MLRCGLLEAADAISPASCENTGTRSIKNIFCFVVIDSVTDGPMGVFEREDRACAAAEAYTNQEGVGCQVLEVRKERRDVYTDWVTLFGPLIMFAIEGLLGAEEELAFGMLMEALNRLWAKSFKRSELGKLQKLVHGALTHISILFPLYQYDIIAHLLHHIVDGIAEYGPPWAVAMWAFERLWGRLIHGNQSKSYPATSIMKNVRAKLLAWHVWSNRDSLLQGDADSDDDEDEEVRTLVHTVCLKAALSVIVVLHMVNDCVIAVYNPWLQSTSTQEYQQQVYVASPHGHVL